MLRAIGLTLLLALSVSACNTVTPNTLSATDTADLRFTSVEVKFPETAPLRWSAGDYEYMRARGIDTNDPAVIETPEARIAIREIAASSSMRPSRQAAVTTCSIAPPKTTRRASNAGCWPRSASDFPQRGLTAPTRRVRPFAFGKSGPAWPPPPTSP